jgi:hypothetical protein
MIRGSGFGLDPERARIAFRPAGARGTGAPRPGAMPGRGNLHCRALQKVRFQLDVLRETGPASRTGIARGACLAGVHVPNPAPGRRRAAPR